MSTSSEGVLAFVKLSAFTAVVGALDYWLWPQLNSARLLVIDNSTQELMAIDSNKESVEDYLDDFFDQWHTNECLHDQNYMCEFHLFLATYGLFGLGTFTICAMMHKLPRFGLAYAIFDGTFFNVFHQYIVRGRYLPPDSLALWGAQFGTFSGPTLWGCLCFMCETDNRQVLAMPQP